MNMPYIYVYKQAFPVYFAYFIIHKDFFFKEMKRIFTYFWSVVFSILLGCAVIPTL